MKRTSKHRAAKPRNVREREDQRDAFAALALMRREGLLASEAVKVEGTTLANLEKYVGPALKRRGKDYVATPVDDFTRVMRVPDAKGVRPTEVPGSKAASMVGHYWNALSDALAGRRSALKEFQGKTIPGTETKFLTDLKILQRLQDGGQFENIKEIYWHGRRR